MLHLVLFFPYEIIPFLIFTVDVHFMRIYNMFYSFFFPSSVVSFFVSLCSGIMHVSDDFTSPSELES